MESRHWQCLQHHLFVGHYGAQSLCRQSTFECSLYRPLPAQSRLPMLPEIWWCRQNQKIALLLMGVKLVCLANDRFVFFHQFSETVEVLDLLHIFGDIGNCLYQVFLSLNRFEIGLDAIIAALFLAQVHKNNWSAKEGLKSNRCKYLFRAIDKFYGTFAPALGHVVARTIFTFEVELQWHDSAHSHNQVDQGRRRSQSPVAWNSRKVSIL